MDARRELEDRIEHYAYKAMERRWSAWRHRDIIVICECGMAGGVTPEDADTYANLSCGSCGKLVALPEPPGIEVREGIGIWATPHIPTERTDA
jgi:hypothetical protein